MNRKEMGPELVEAMKKANASRAEFIKRNPKFIPQDKPQEKRFEITPQIRRSAELKALHEGEIH